MTPAQLKQRSNAGKASAAASKERLGEHVYGAKMQQLGQNGGRKGGWKGGRPTWQEALEKEKRKSSPVGPV